jgi:hypothetical protein
MDQEIEIVASDGQKHFIWADSAADTWRQGEKWAQQHGGLQQVKLLDDERDGCWERAGVASLSAA